MAVLLAWFLKCGMQMSVARRIQCAALGGCIMHKATNNPGIAACPVGQSRVSVGSLLSAADAPSKRDPAWHETSGPTSVLTGKNADTYLH